MESKLEQRIRKALEKTANPLRALGKKNLISRGAGLAGVAGTAIGAGAGAISAPKGEKGKGALKGGLIGGAAGAGAGAVGGAKLHAMGKKLHKARVSGRARSAAQKAKKTHEKVTRNVYRREGYGGIY